MSLPTRSELDTRIRDKNHMLNIHNGNFYENCLLVSFDAVNVFPSINNKIGIKSVKNILLNRDNKLPPSECIIEALELRLNFNNSNVNKQHYLQMDGTAQDPHMSYSYSDFAMYSYNLTALSYVLAIKCWKCFHDDVFILWEHFGNDLDFFIFYEVDRFICKNTIYLILVNPSTVLFV